MVADQLEGRVVRVDRDGLLVERGGRVGQLRRGWAEAGLRWAFDRGPFVARTAPYS